MMYDTSTGTFSIFPTFLGDFNPWKLLLTTVGEGPCSVKMKLGVVPTFSLHENPVGLPGGPPRNRYGRVRPWNFFRLSTILRRFQGRSGRFLKGFRGPGRSGDLGGGSGLVPEFLVE